MGLKRTLPFRAIMMILLALVLTGIEGAQAQNPWMPAYGSGVVEVRVYTDYFCPPCRAMESEIGAVLKDLIEKNVIRLSFVDVPLHQLTPLFATYFLYAIRENDDLEQAFRLRGILNEAATNKEIATPERIEALFTEKGIAYGAWDTKPTFDRYFTLLKEDTIKATPTCVIIKNGQREQYAGSDAIIAALRALL